MGYSSPFEDAWPLYPYEDYLAVIDHLKTTTGPETRVANALFATAINSPAGRLSAFPAESMTWLKQVRWDDEARFLEMLEATPDSVVVWDITPGSYNEEWQVDHPAMVDLVRRLYKFDVKFGDIEVWRRKPGANAPDPAKGAR